jgi:hypothetical protein
MGNKVPRSLDIGIDDGRAIALLERLAKEDDLRKNLEKTPAKILKDKFNIDFPNAPDAVTLPNKATIQTYVDELNAERAKAGGGKYANLPHGIVLLYVAHGNGLPSP